MPCVTVWPTPNGSPIAKHDVADLQLVGVGKIERREALLGALDAQHREIAALVLQHDVGCKLALVGERDLHFAGIRDDVIIGDDEAGRINDDAGAERALDLLARHAAAEELAEKRVGHKRVAVLDDPRRVDVHHGRRDPLHDRREGELKLGIGRWNAALLGARGRRKRQEEGQGA